MSDIHPKVTNPALETLDVLNGRLVELDLLEQALNDGRDLATYKLQRLEDLIKRIKAAKAPNQPQGDELRKRIVNITGGWLASTLADCDVHLTQGDVAWRTRKINDELVDLVVSERNNMPKPCASQTEQATPATGGEGELRTWLLAYRNAKTKGLNDELEALNLTIQRIESYTQARADEIVGERLNAAIPKRWNEQKEEEPEVRQFARGYNDGVHVFAKNIAQVLGMKYDRDDRQLTKKETQTDNSDMETTV